VAELAWSNDPESNVVGSMTSGSVTYSRPVEGDNPVKKGYPGPPGWKLSVGPATPQNKKYVLLKFLKHEATVLQGL
jgi:hypothetical protein